MLNYSNETSFTNFSSVTESTRITPKTNNDTFDETALTWDGDTTKTNEMNNLGSNLTLNNDNRSLTGQVYPNKIDKRGETSNWIKELDEENNSVITRGTDLQTGSRKKVRVVPNTFSASDFICQRLDMLSSYEQLLNDMNSFYRNPSEGHTNQTTIGNLSDQSDNSYKQDPMDSLEIESAKKNPQQFLIGILFNY